VGAVQQRVGAVKNLAVEVTRRFGQRHRTPASDAVLQLNPALGGVNILRYHLSAGSGMLMCHEEGQRAVAEARDDLAAVG